MAMQHIPVCTPAIAPPPPPPPPAIPHLDARQRLRLLERPRLPTEAQQADQPHRTGAANLGGQGAASGNQHNKRLYRDTTRVRDRCMKTRTRHTAPEQRTWGVRCRTMHGQQLCLMRVFWQSAVRAWRLGPGDWWPSPAACGQHASKQRRWCPGEGPGGAARMLASEALEVTLTKACRVVDAPRSWG